LLPTPPLRCLHGPRRPCCPPFPLACPLLTSQLVFAILGVQLFGGRLASCVLYIPPPSSRLALPPSDPAFRGDTLLVPMRGFANRSACEGAAAGLEAAYDLGRIASGTLCDRAELVGNLSETRCRLLWHLPISGFEDVGQGLLTLTEVATLQGWGRLAHVARHARGLFVAPSTPGDESLAPGSSVAAVLFFILYILIMGFLLIKVCARLSRARHRGMLMPTEGCGP
jgi:hypothetical protein